MSDPTISAELAKEHVDGLMAYYMISMDDGNSDQQQARRNSYDKVIQAVRSGRLEIKEDMTVVQRVKDNAPLTYRELDGRAKLAMGKCADSDHHGKAYALLGALSGAGANAIHMLKGPDLTAAEHLAALFFSG